MRCGVGRTLSNARGSCGQGGLQDRYVLAPEGYTEASLRPSLVGVGINGGSGRELRDPDIRDTRSWAMSLFAAGKHMLDR